MVKSQFLYVRILLKCKIFTKNIIVNINFVNHIVKKSFWVVKSQYSYVWIQYKCKNPTTLVVMKNFYFINHILKKGF